VKNALAIAAQKYGRLDVAVNCAGIGIAAVTYNQNKDRVHELKDFMKVVTVSLTCKGCTSLQFNWSQKNTCLQECVRIMKSNLKQRSCRTEHIADRTCAGQFSL